MVLSMERWKGKVVIVTGASAGIGAAIAEGLVKEGMKVVGLARRKEIVEDLSAKLQGEPGKLYAVKADLTKEEDILQAFEWVKTNVGPIHVLVNNAGIGRLKGLTDGETKDWKDILDTNVLGLCIATREAIKDMKANNVDGHIIHINSCAGHTVIKVPDFTMNIYPASKYAVTALTETLRQELNLIKSGIKVTSISPGCVRTDIMQTSGHEMTSELVRQMKETPALDVEDMADSVVYVLSTPPHVQVHELMIKPIGEQF